MRLMRPLGEDPLDQGALGKQACKVEWRLATAPPVSEYPKERRHPLPKVLHPRDELPLRGSTPGHLRAPEKVARTTIQSGTAARDGAEAVEVQMVDGTVRGAFRTSVSGGAALGSTLW